MFLAIFFSICYSEYIEITNENVDSLIGGEKPILVKFYSPGCGHCKAMAEDFEEGSTMFTEAHFGGVDCSSQNKICDKYKISGYPTIQLFPKGKTEGIEFNSERTADGFADFVEENTGVKAKRPPKLMVDANPINFGKLTSEHKCVFMTFYAPWCGHCKRFLPQAKIAAGAFKFENSTIIGSVNCDKYKSFCEEHNIQGFPTIQLFKESQPVEYSGDRSAQGIVTFLNENCGTERGIDGLLHEKSGLIEEAQPIIQEFLLENDKTESIKKMEKIQGSDFYIKVMKRIQEKGIETAKKDMIIMQNILSTQKGSISSLDGLKKRLNIYTQFIPVQQEEIPKTEL